MHESLRSVVLAMLILLGAAAGPLQAAEPDVAGSRDPYGVERYPRSWIVEYHRVQEFRPREFVMSRVDRIRRELRIEDRLRLDAGLESVTYRIAEGADVDDVVAHYAEALGGDVLFRCAGRDCGRSNDWANQIFGQATLYGPDRNQRYVAWEWQGRLVALYAIERGNQRVYAHLRFLDPEGSLGLEPNALLRRRLAERGWAAVEAVHPRPDGSLDAAEQALLRDLAGSLARFAGEPLYAVCHLYGRGGSDELLAASRRCAETAAEIIAGSDGTLNVVPFGAGPLLPRGTSARARLEIVLPGLVFRQRD